MFLWTAFLVGIVGSLHCVGMCGPIALAMPYRSEHKLGALANVFIYNIGRIITYASLGLIIGLLGQTFALAGIQQYISIGLGILLIAIAFFSINVEHKLLKIPFLSQLNNWVKLSMGKLLREGQSKTLFSLGMLNGLLPCGLVYMAVVGAVSTGSILKGAAYMALFGMGTMPLMIGTALLGQFIPLKWRGSIRKVLPIFLIFFALLFLSRGLNFHLPDEMRFWEIGQDIPMCD